MYIIIILSILFLLLVVIVFIYKPRPIKILSISCYGYGNIGDNMYSDVFNNYLNKDCIIKKIRDNLMFIDSDSNLSTTIPQTDWDFDVLLIGGGGILNKTKLLNSETLRYYTDKSILNKKPIYIISCGIQADEFGDDWKRIWNYASLITVRSPEDKRIILKNTPNANVIYQRDLGYIAPHCGKYNIKKNKKNKLSIIVSGPVNPSNTEVKNIVNSKNPEEIMIINTGARYDKDMKEFIDSADFNGIKTTKLYGMGIAHEFNFKNLKIDEDLDVNSTLQIINDSFLVLTGRYHGMIFSRSLNIPYDTMGMSTNKMKWEEPANSDNLNDILSSYENIRLLKNGLGLKDSSEKDIRVLKKSIGYLN